MTDDIAADIYQRLRYAKSRNTGARLEPEMVEHILNNIAPFFDKSVVKQAKLEKKKTEKERKARQKKRYREIRKLIKLQESRVVTAKLAKAILEDRKAGMKYYEIAIKHKVSISTAQRHGNPFIGKKQREKEQRALERKKQDPEWLVKRREYARAYYQKRKEAQQNANV